MQLWAALAMLITIGRRSIISSAICPGNSTADDVLSGHSFRGQLAIVTGGDGGLGYAISQALLKHGAHVIVASRNEARGRLKLRELRESTGGSAEWMHLDLGSFAAIRNFSEDFTRIYGNKLNLLINNAGIDGPSFLTGDGFESVFQVDYLGHFLLTELLLPALRSSTPSRVVNVASGSHVGACLDAGFPKNCFADWSYLPPPVVPRTASSYGIAKFAQIQHAAVLAKREAAAGIVATSITPGFAKTPMTAAMQPQEVAATCAGPEMAKKLAHECPFTPAEATAVMAWCSVADVESGLYYSRVLDCAPCSVDMQGFTESMRDELYSRSLGWVGLAPSEYLIAYM